MKKLVLLVAFLLSAVAAFATTHICNIDKTSLIWTGNTRIEWGQLLYEHKCLQDHRFWLTAEQMNQ